LQDGQPLSKSTKPRSRQLTRAQLKAYEARRGIEMSQSTATTGAEAVAPRAATSTSVRRVQPLTRAEEYAIIRSDLRRLLWILAVLATVLVVLTFVLR
jgi:hypothetical protein